MFRTFLKVADACSVCDEEFYHPHADDFLAYCVIVIVGHILVPLVHIVEKQFEPPNWVHVALWIPGARASEQPVGRSWRKLWRGQTRDAPRGRAPPESLSA